MEKSEAGWFWQTLREEGWPRHPIKENTWVSRFRAKDCKALLGQPASEREWIMDKNKILPVLNPFQSAETQRDADWDRVKPLLKVLEDILSYPTTFEVVHMFQIGALEALGKMGIEQVVK